MSQYLPKNKKAKQLARTLRKNMTKEERHLWYDFLRGYKPSFHRQYVVEGFIVDFFCPSARLAIELDGSQHYEADSVKKDELRTSGIESFGIAVARYTNLDIRQRFNEVCADIDCKVKQRINQTDKIRTIEKEQCI